MKNNPIIIICVTAMVLLLMLSQDSEHAAAADFILVSSYNHEYRNSSLMDTPDAAPTDISLSSDSVAENEPVGTAVGTFTTTDPDGGDIHTYTLVAGTGDTDNGSFTIAGNQLQTAEVFDFETQGTYSILVRTDDGSGGTFDESFSITINDANDPPTDISLSSDSVAENEPVGTAVGTFTTTDPDGGDSHTYTLVAGTGDTDNGSFTIAGNQLQTAEVFDFETQGTYSILVRTDDGSGGTFDESFSITINDANDPPTDISLSSDSVAENEPVGTAVGTFTTTDPDGGDIHTYTLVAGTGDTDNGSFTIAGNQLQTAEVFDFETQGTYSILVRTDDGSGGTFDESFSITINDSNEPPADISLSNDSVSENEPVGTVVGTFTTTDPDVGDSHTYTLVAGTGDTDNGSFTIAGNQLQTAEVFDFETQRTYSILVRTDDGSGGTFDESFSITINDANEPPADISLSSDSVAENEPVGTAVGTFTTTDPDVGDSHTYTLVAGTGDTDNGSFTIAGNQLQTAEVFDFETQGTYSILVRTDDGSGGTFDESFSITINNANEPPADISLSSDSVAENEPVGTAVGTFTTTDPDGGDSHTYTLVAGTGDTDNGSFTIAVNQLQTAEVFDFETQGTYSILVRTDDGSGGTFDESFIIIIINDANEPPTDISLSSDSVAENEPVGTAVGTFTTTDPDVGDSHTYTLVAGTGDTDNGSFTIAVNQLQTAEVFDFETQGTYSILVRTDDGSGGTFDESFSITINDANEPPADISLSNDSVSENEPVGTVVGTFTTTDPDVGDSHTYTLVTGAGDTDNGSFTIAGNQLQTAEVFDFEAQDTYSILVRTDDGSGGTFDESFIIIIINDANEPPTDISLSSDSVAENEPVGTAVGTFTTTDPDVGDSHTYTLVAGTGDTDNGSFTIAVNQLQTAEVFDFETQGTYSILVRTDDGSGGTFDESFSITINDANEPPTVSDVDKSGNEDNDILFAASDFTNQFDDEDGDSLNKIMVTSLPANGTLELSASPVSVNDKIVTADLNDLTFTPDANWHGATSFGWNGHDGTVYAADGAIVNITIHPVNDAPEIDLNGSQSGTGFTAIFAAGYGPVTIVDTDLELTDVDNTTLHSATVTLTNNPDGAAERLAADTSGTNITASYDAGDDELNLSGEDTVARYQQVMRTVTYDNTTQNPDNTPRTVEFMINDGADDSNVALASVNIINPNIAIAKTPNTQDLASGGTASFTIAITNSGDVSLDDIKVTDPLTDDCSRDNLGTLLPGGSLSYTCSRPNVTADFLNEAAVTGLDPLGNAVSDTDSAFVDIHNPNIAIAKTPDTQTIPQGGTAFFTITITNTGNVTLFNIKVSDLLVADCDRDNLGDLEVGENTSYSCSRSNVTQSFLNEATVTGQDPLSNTVSSSDTAFVQVENPVIRIIKSPNSQTVLKGDTVFFNINVINTSETVNLINVKVFDPDSVDCNEDIGDLAANEDYGYSCQETDVTAAFVNIATVIGTNSASNDSVNDSDYADVDVLDITIDISAEPPSLPEPGGSVEFTIVVTNDSSKEVTLTKLDSDDYGELTDPGNDTVQNNSCIPNPAPPILVANGGIYTCSFMGSVTGDSGESETLTVMASADDGDGHIVDDSDQAAITITDRPIVFQFLPVVFNNYIPDEPNDLCTEAYPITINHDYYFLADDVDDWYQFDLPNSGNLVVELTNFVPVKGQITAWRETDPGNCRSSLFLGNNGDFSPTKIMDLGIQPAGHYYIWLINDGPINTVDPYKLRVKFP